MRGIVLRSQEYRDEEKHEAETLRVFVIEWKTQILSSSSI